MKKLSLKLIFLLVFFPLINCSDNLKSKIIGKYYGEKTLHGEAELEIQKNGQFRFKELQDLGLLRKDSGTWTMSGEHLFLNSKSKTGYDHYKDEIAHTYLFKNQKAYIDHNKIMIPDAKFPNSIFRSYIFEKLAIDSTKNDQSFFPTKIEFGAIGKGSNKPATVLIIEKEFVKIATIEGKNFTFQNTITDLDDLILALDEEDIKDKIHYYHPHFRDGGYMTLSNKTGYRMFTNTFGNGVDKSAIKPDTFGLSKFEAIAKSAKVLLQGLSN